MNSSGRVSSRPKMTGVIFSVLGVFLICFSVPFLLTVKLGGMLIGTPTEVSHDADGKENVFPTSFRVARSGDAFRVSHGEGLSPEPGKDFLFSVWFKLSKPLEVGQRAVLLGKYDPKSKLRPGFSLALQRDLDGTRPMLYWGGEKEPGKWYTFSPLENSGRAWTFLSISFRKGSLLGMHTASLDSNSPVQLLGGYEIDSSASASNDADLVVGAFGDSEFRGRIGPLSIVSEVGLSDTLVDTISSLRDAREVLPSALSSQISLWVSGKVDLSEKKHKVAINSSKLSSYSDGMFAEGNRKRLS